MKELGQTFEKQLVPIKPESFLQKINPYRGSLKYFIKNAENGKHFVRVALELTALMLSPGGVIYIEKQKETLQRKVSLEKGESRIVRPDVDNAGLAYAIDILKILFTGGISYLMIRM